MVLQGQREAILQLVRARVAVGDVQHVEASVGGGQRGLCLRYALNRQPTEYMVVKFESN